MVQLKQITRSATFAWSPAQGKPLIASGTIAGAVDASFSQDSELEIWDLDLDNTDTAAFELAPAAKISTERKYGLCFSKSLTRCRFYSLAWGYVTPERPKGVIAGAMDDGHLNIWDVNAILANTPQTALVTSNATHRGSIKVVEFNPVTPKILMSAGQGGEVSKKSFSFSF
jgi:protein transport protein SEC31